MGFPKHAKYKEQGIIVSIPSLGPIRLFDDLEGLFKWAASGTGGDYTVEKSTSVAFNGSASAHLKAKTTTPTASDSVSMTRYLSMAPGKKLNLECQWRVEAKAELQRIMFQLERFDGVDSHSSIIRWNGPSTQWQYRNDQGAYVDIEGGVQDFLDAEFRRVAITIDFEKDEYVTVVADENVMSLAGTAILVSSSATAPSLKLTITLYNESTTEAEGYIDDILVREVK